MSVPRDDGWKLSLEGSSRYAVGCISACGIKRHDLLAVADRVFPPLCCGTDFGLAGLPTSLLGASCQNDTREEVGRPALLSASTIRSVLNRQ